MQMQHQKLCWRKRWKASDFWESNRCISPKLKSVIGVLPRHIQTGSSAVRHCWCATSKAHVNKQNQPTDRLVRSSSFTIIKCGGEEQVQWIPKQTQARVSTVARTREGFWCRVCPTDLWGDHKSCTQREQQICEHRVLVRVPTLGL